MNADVLPVPAPLRTVVRRRGAGTARLHTVLGGRRDLLVGGIVFLVYSRLAGVVAEEIGAPSPLQPFVLIAFVYVWWRERGSVTAAAVVRTFVLGIGVFAVATLPGLFRPDPSATVAMLSVLSQDVLFVAAVIYIVVARGSIRAAVWGMVAALALLSLTTLAHTAGIDIGGGFWGLARSNEQLVSDVEHAERAIGPYNDPNFFAQALVMLVAVTLERARRAPSRRSRRAAAAVAALGVAAVAATYSRGGLIGLTLLVGYQLWRDPPPVRRIIVAAAAAVVALVMLMPTSVVERLSSVESAVPGSAHKSSDVSIRGRASEALAALHMFEDHPLTGVGYGSYDERYVEYSSRIGLDFRREERGAHNLYLEIGAETGLLGWCAAAVGAAIVWRSSRRRVIDLEGSAESRSIAIGLRAAVLGFAATAVFLHDANTRPWVLCIGLAVAAGQLPLERRWSAERGIR